MSHILVIEDHVQNARLVKKLLRRNDHTVILADCGEEGLKIAFESKFDLILMDLGLPDMDGQTLITVLRQRPEFRAVPIIAFTAWPPDDAQNMVKAYGYNGIITKPIEMAHFLATIENYLKAGDGKSRPVPSPPDADLN